MWEGALAMTEQQIRQLVVDTSRGWLGCKESDGSHQQIIDLYNSHKPLARGYAVKYSDAWCATFVSAVTIKAGLTDIMPTECGCEPMISLYKNHSVSKWEENEDITPEIGDVIFYDWEDSGSGNDTGAADHVGIVAAVSGSTITVIEGNYSNSVKERKLSVNGKYIRGYGKPAYSTKATGKDDFDMDINEARAKLTSCADTGDSASDWAKDATDYCKRKGIFAGDGNGNFGWQQPITREAVAQIIYNAFEAAGMLNKLPDA
jgi:hypothetical protein